MGEGRLGNGQAEAVAGQPAERTGPGGVPFGRRAGRLVIMSGLPGTGKSHLAQLAAERSGAIVLRSDALRKLLFPQPDYSARESRTVYEAAYALIAYLVAEGYPVIFDATNLSAWTRARAAGIAARVGGAALVVQTTAPEEVVRERLTARGRPGVETFLSDAGWEVYTNMRGRLEPVTPDAPDALLVDTSDPAAVAAAVERMVAFLSEAPLARRLTQPQPVAVQTTTPAAT
jgi:predicted kinase